MVEFAQFTLVVLREQVLANPQYVDLILNGPYLHRTYSMGLVDDKNRVELLRRQGARRGPRRPRARASTRPRDYAKHIAERVEPWTYLKFPYLHAGRVEGLRGRQAVGRLPRDARRRASTSPTR